MAKKCMKSCSIPLALRKRKMKTKMTETINPVKRQPIKWDGIFANHVFDKGLISKIHKEHLQFDSKNN